jgi:hypothetical protein
MIDYNIEKSIKKSPVPGENERAASIILTALQPGTFPQQNNLALNWRIGLNSKGS